MKNIRHCVLDVQMQLKYNDTKQEDSMNDYKIKDVALADFGRKENDRNEENFLWYLLY